MDFDVDVFSGWILNIRPEYVWLGLNSKKKPQLPEPSVEKLTAFAEIIVKSEIPVKGKHLRGMNLHGVEKHQD